MTTFEILHPEDYLREYPRLGAALGVPDAAPAPGEVEWLTEVTARDWRGIGMLPLPDAFFAAAVASILAPPVLLEIGTASGFSAALFAKMLALREQERGAAGSGPLVHTIDKKADFCFDQTQRVGFVIERVTPELRDRIALHPLHDSALCSSLTKLGDLRLAFVDGNHQHPWPLVDVMRLQCLMTGGWLLLHDINLPALVTGAHARGEVLDFEPNAGAQHVFDFWPGERVKAGNIGAVKVPADPHSLGEMLAKLRALPAEVSAGSWKKRWREIEETQAG